MKKRKNNPVGQGRRKRAIVSLLFFLLLAAVGIGFGEPSRVLQQATQICLSCIGIG